MKRLLAYTIAVGALALVPGFADAQTKLKLLSSWDRTNFATFEAGLVFADEVKRISAGKVEIDIKGPETVPPFQQLQPVAAGAFDLLFSHGVYHAGSKGLALVADAIEGDPAKRREVGITDYFDKYYQKNQKLAVLGMAVIGQHGYQLVLREALSPAGDFQGKKIRGTQSYFGVIKALGGTPVVLPGGEVYSALEKGVVDGAAWPASGVITMKWHEVAKFRMRPTFGNSTLPIWANMAAWSKLSEADRKSIMEAMISTEKIMLVRGDETFNKEEADLEKAGMKTAQLPPDKADLIKKTWVTSLWEVAQSCCADGAKDLRDLALKHNMTF